VTSWLAGQAAAAEANRSLGGLATVPFNDYQQYDSWDIEVTASVGSDLAARLPSSWMPMAKNTPLFETAMRQRGYVVGCLASPHLLRCSFAALAEAASTAPHLHAECVARVDCR
jgi:hypothetical protein